MFPDINFKKFLLSLKFAISGIRVIFREEQSFRIQVIISVVVITSIFYFKLSAVEAVVIFTIMFLVLMAELINSLFERILDIVHPSDDIKVKKIKDMASGIVLLCCIAAATIGFLIFWPHIRF